MTTKNKESNRLSSSAYFVTKKPLKEKNKNADICESEHLREVIAEQEEMIVSLKSENLGLEGKLNEQLLVNIQLEAKNQNLEQAFKTYKWEKEEKQKLFQHQKLIEKSRDHIEELASLTKKIQNTIDSNLLAKAVEELEFFRTNQKGKNNPHSQRSDLSDHNQELCSPHQLIHATINQLWKMIEQLKGFPFDKDQVNIEDIISRQEQIFVDVLNNKLELEEILQKN